MGTPLLQALAASVRVAKREAKAAAGLILASELKARRRVLRRLGCAALCVCNFRPLNTCTGAHTAVCLRAGMWMRRAW